MTTRLTKERVLFLAGALLFAWAAVRLGVFESHRGRTAGPPSLAAAPCQQGDPRLADSLATPPLARCLGPGDPFDLAGRTPAIEPRGKGDRAPKPELDLAAIGAEIERQLAALRNQGKGRLTVIVALFKDDGGHRAAKRKSFEFAVADGHIPPPPLPPRSFDLAGTLRVETPGAAGWALLRDRTSRALLCGTVGDLVGGTFRLQAIHDDGATLITPQGTQITLPGRFAGSGQP